MTVHIADTNVLVKYVVPEEFSSVARRIIGQYDDAQLRLIAPDYIFIECANVLWKYVRRNNLSVANAVSALRELQRLNILLIPHGELLEDALLFAANTGITVYDALFCVLARRENAELITADIALVNRLVGTSIRVRPLADWER